MNKKLLPEKKKKDNDKVLKREVERVIRSTEKEIDEGLSNPLSGTGTPIEELHGGSKFMSQLSNIGGGSKENGGGGVEKGIETLRKNDRAKGAKVVLDAIKAGKKRGEIEKK